MSRSASSAFDDPRVAVVAMRFDSSEIGESLTEIVAYGTAVIVAAKA